MVACNECDSESRKNYIGDIGTEIIVDACEDISTSTVSDLIVMKPDGTSETWTGAVYDTTKIKYIVVDGDFDQVGTYRMQVYVVMPFWKGRGGTAFFKVRALFS